MNDKQTKRARGQKRAWAQIIIDKMEKRKTTKRNLLSFILLVLWPFVVVFFWVLLMSLDHIELVHVDGRGGLGR